MAYRQLLQFCQDAAHQIRQECDELLLAAETKSSPQLQQSLLGCGPALVSLLSRQASVLARLELRDTSTTDLLAKRLEDILSISYSKFYCFLFKDLPVYWRQLYTDACILKFHLLLFQATSATGSDQGTMFLDEPVLAELVKTLDLALILAGAAGEQRGRIWVGKALDLLHEAWTSTQPENDDGSVRPTKRAKLAEKGDELSAPVDMLSAASFSTFQPFTPPVENPIPRHRAMSVEAFQTYMDSPSDSNLGPEPLIFTDLVEEWPARTTHPWCKPFYLLSRTFGGHRLVPVEIGRSYVDEGWGQKLITFGTLLQDYIDPSLSPDHVAQSDKSPASKQIAYLAQHPLLTQLPALRNDIRIPDLCYTSPPPHPTDSSKDQPEVDEPMLNAWFGPPGTITPLHNDPYHNLLVQVVGHKYVRLYSPLHTEQMHARGKEDGVEMGNTSSLDVGALEGWDRPAEDQQPSPDEQASEEMMRKALKDVPYVDCILNPGDTLYIPIGWWHYVRGLSVSFSVSFWWN
ncbi:hypothetical protein PG996_009455 [Apiospora saccharicola]|uniref:JmjC domain-containing protein n=1 Tax=Apiospora saccharicola TaxID=335842 RepID=A0ABR1UN84_9PEZI